MNIYIKAIVRSWASSKSQLIFGLILLAIGFLLAGQCVMEMDSVKPMFVAFIMILVGALFRSLHYYDKQDE